MTREEILLYGALLESDMYVDGYGSTEDDAVLLRKALEKVYEVNEFALEEEKRAVDDKITEDLKELVISYREKVRKFIEELIP